MYTVFYAIQEIAGADNKLLDDIIRFMDEIRTPHQTVALTDGFEMTNLLPSELLSARVTPDL